MIESPVDGAFGEFGARQSCGCTLWRNTIYPRIHPTKIEQTGLVMAPSGQTSKFVPHSAMFYLEVRVKRMGSRLRVFKGTRHFTSSGSEKTTYVSSRLVSHIRMRKYRSNVKATSGLRTPQVHKPSSQLCSIKPVSSWVPRSPKHEQFIWSMESVLSAAACQPRQVDRDATFTGRFSSTLLVRGVFRDRQYSSCFPSHLDGARSVMCCNGQSLVCKGEDKMSKFSSYRF